LGDLYGRAVLDLLRYRLAASETTQLGLCIYLPVEPQAPPSWTEAQVVRYLEDTYRELEALLDLGPFQRLLPVHLRRAAPSSSSLTSRASSKRSSRCGRWSRPTLWLMIWPNYCYKHLPPIGLRARCSSSFCQRYPAW
jgi:hypothetical protein